MLRPLLRLMTTLLAVVAVVTLGLAQPAAAQTPFTISVSDGTIDEAGGQTVLTLQLVPGSEPVAAMTVEVVFDTSLLQVIATQALVGGSCNQVNGSAVFAGLDVNGWSSPIDLCEITVSSVGGSGTTPATPLVQVAVNASSSPQDVFGTAVAGSIVIGGATPSATPTQLPSVQATPTPIPEPTATPTPEPAEVDEDPTQPEEPTPEPPIEDGATSDPESEPVPESTTAAEPAPDQGEQEDADQAGAALDPDRGTRATPEPGAPTSESAGDTGADAGENSAVAALDEESAAPVLPPAATETASPDGAASPDAEGTPVSLSRGTDGPGTATIATAAIALLAVGVGLGAAARRANRHTD